MDNLKQYQRELREKYKEHLMGEEYVTHCKT